MSPPDPTPIPPPHLVIHCDWGSSPPKRWMATALYHQGTYTASAPQPVGDPVNLLTALRKQTKGPILVGFDFPIGLPRAFANQLAIDSFPTFLRQLAQPTRRDFFSVCRDRSSISLSRPFYPYNSTPKGSRKLSHLLEALNLQTPNQLLRTCEQTQPGIHAAGALFWTVGAKAPGRAALHGWANVLIPALNTGHLRLWPFDGTLAELLQPTHLVIAETYPTQYHRALLNAPFLGKGNLENRRLQAPPLLAWSKASAVQLDPQLIRHIHAGFPQGDDAFDAVLGLFGMLHLLLNPHQHHEPTDPVIRNLEGWILGQPAR